MGAGRATPPGNVVFITELFGMTQWVDDELKIQNQLPPRSIHYKHYRGAEAGALAENRQRRDHFGSLRQPDWV